MAKIKSFYSQIHDLAEKALNAGRPYEEVAADLQTLATDLVRFSDGIKSDWDKFGQWDARNYRITDREQLVRIVK